MTTSPADRPGPRSGGRAGARDPAPSPRAVVERLVAQQLRAFPTLHITAPDDALLPDPRDAALAHALYDAVVARWLTLAGLIDLVSDNPAHTVPAPLRAIVMVGAAQVLLMDRVPVYAAIDQAVESAKRTGGRRAGGFANAVLRRVARLLPDGGAQRHQRPMWSGSRDEIPLAGGGSLVLEREVLPESLAPRLALATSLPEPLVARWIELRGESAASALAHHSIASPPIVLNVEAAPSIVDAALAPHADPTARVLTGDRAALRALLERCPGIWVQDAGSARAVRLARRLRPSLVVDLCAGQGTKTRQLAHAFPDARVIATDTHAGRLAVLRDLFRDHPRVSVMPIPAALDAARARADLVLADVPCSNSGVLPRRLEARYRRDARGGPPPDLLALQRSIMATAADLLARPGGRLLYSTCSIDAEENSEQLAHAARALGLTPEAEEADDPAGLPGDPPSTYLDGGYRALAAAN